MKFYRRRRADNGINLTPLIDVVFPLDFLYGHHHLYQESRLLIELPEADAEVVDSAQVPVELVISGMAVTLSMDKI